MEMIQDVQAIDVHAHYGAYPVGRSVLIARFMGGDADVIVARARLANTALSIVSPLKALMPRFKADAAAGNEEAASVVPELDELRQWVVVHPLQPRTYDQADQMLLTPKCVGIKIHPEEHGYPIKEHGRAIFEFAAHHEAVVLTHSGEANSMPEDFVPFADDFPQVKLIVAHLGCTCDEEPDHQVRAIQSSRHGNVYVDTSSSNSIKPRLIEWAVAEVGPQRLLYGTDTPLYWAPMQRVRIDTAEIGDDAKRMILRENAMQLLNLGD